ncbi:tRNA (adenosine(37)-N6)-threonylcarbamoyltransferase complex dimerization subunit type 1 TsaB [Picosynechococcus sp. PCC 7117]|uniref:tRNA (adenosine(37)-N6)-threonylcarbamoyltransferase complex dimerization subunit type 1 TsaB n=1 Tax=Picosynechococcus sp. PCC 7117 TaxID=195498 RepID=UPI000810A717|nr:tRNA (adenosine(37)-N6)-threonylcarbamoyltransferase complex dimerization subunit type 1 TsaB [Picosynechococcus sp. PCC 7117]ANV86351.1 tRNA N6-adenosine(37)-N6-threonylcarbamoyltransferase complex dimerization subunit TsaB [Picosynechococcus sp. PCC 7117]
MAIAPEPTLGLALHTTTPQLGLSLRNLVTGEQRTALWELGRDLSAQLHCYLQEFIQPHAWQDIAFLGVAKGPGGFTGTRLGVVTARTLAQQLNIPLYGISTLAAIAQRSTTGCAFQNRENCLGQTVAVALPARRGAVFGAIYQITATGAIALVPDQLFTPTAWADCQGNFPDLQVIDPPETIGDTVTEVLSLAQSQWQADPQGPWGAVVPFYGQHPVYQ